MSALAEQHTRWSEARGRLGVEPPPPVRVRLVASMPSQPRVEPEPQDTEPATKAAILELLDETDDVLWRDGVKSILRAYCETMRRLISHQRDRNIIECRFAVAMYLRRRGWSYPRIGQVMNRDHSSIVHLLNPARRREAYRQRSERERESYPR